MLLADTTADTSLIAYETDGGIQYGVRPDGGRHAARAGAELEHAVRGFRDPRDGDSRQQPGDCVQDLEAKATIVAESVTSHKMACSKGRNLAVCQDDTDCLPHICSGGNGVGANGDPIGGQPVDPEDTGGYENYVVCLESGGTVVVPDGGGVCTKYTESGSAYGTDGYEAAYSGYFQVEGPKVNLPGPSSVWIDTPGWPNRAIGSSGPLKYDGDYVAKMSGPAGGCQCHFTVEVDINSAGQQTSRSAITLVNDSDTVNCISTEPASDGGALDAGTKHHHDGGTDGGDAG